ncbi:MAG: hypothetical protein ACXIUM_10115 [Wenzhouxiangella sp.]
MSRSSATAIRPFEKPLLRSACLLLAVIALSACGSRQVQDSLVGSTAQRLVSYAVDEMARALPDEDFAPLRGQRVRLVSHGIGDPALQAYADARLAVELQGRFGVQLVEGLQESDQMLQVFYTSLGTDQSLLGFFIPLGFMPGVDESTRINLITLEQFHGVVEMYYFLGPSGVEQRGEIVQARRRTDALGLPIITIPISTLP